MPAEAPKLSVNTEIDLYWPPTKQWQRGVIVKDWENGEYAIRFQDDGFEEPLTYRLTAYKYRVVSAQPSQAPPIGEGEFEVEFIVDKVEQPSLMYRVKWKGYELQDCTWEPETNLSKAKNLVEAFEALLRRRDMEDEWKTVRASVEDHAMLTFLWDRLCEQPSDPSTIHWTPDGSAFIVEDTEALAGILGNTSPTFTTYDGFVRRLTTLGFEQQTDPKLFHHPCFNSENRHLIDYIGMYSIPLPSAEQKVLAIRENEDKMIRKAGGQQPVQNGYEDVQMADVSHVNQAGGQNYMGQAAAAAAPYRPTKDFLFNTMFPIESDLDLNCCQQWRESDVGEWAANAFPRWGPDYCAMFVQLGIDGRVLLECDLSVIVRELSLIDHQAQAFEQAVKQLRDIRRTSLENLPVEQAMVDQAMY